MIPSYLTMRFLGPGRLGNIQLILDLTLARNTQCMVLKCAFNVGFCTQPLRFAPPGTIKCDQRSYSFKCSFHMDSKQALLRRNWKTADQKVSLLPILIYDLKRHQTTD